MDMVTVISIVISVAAFILSIIALWQTHFAKFKIVCAAGSLQFKIYPFSNKGENWYIPSVDVPIAITNIGAQVGKIVGLRIQVKYQNLQASNNFEFFSPEWEVDYNKYHPISNTRFEWIDKAVIGNWTPFIVLPKQTITKHIIFEKRWEEPVFHDNVVFELEILTNISKKWQTVAQWNAHLSYGMLDEDIDSVSSFMILEANSETIER